MRARPTLAIVLAGGLDFVGIGIHLSVIEAAANPTDASMRNIEMMDEACRAIIDTTDRLTIVALQGNAGTGGCFLAFACDATWARPGVLLNPRHKNIGNLYGPGHCALIHAAICATTSRSNPLKP